MKVIHAAELKVWEKVGEPKVLAKKFGVAVGIQTYKNPYSGQEEEHSYFTKNEGGTVCAITKEGTVVLVRQFKQAADDFIYEFPAGFLKDGEDAPTMLVRELQEETGYRAQSIEGFGQKALLAPRKSPSGEWSVVALGCELISGQSLDAGEGAIEVWEATVPELWEMIATGQIISASTIITILKAALAGHIAFPEHAT